MTLEEINEYRALKAQIEHCKDKIHEINRITVKSPIFDTSGIPKNPTPRNSTEEKYIKAMCDKEKYERIIAASEERIALIEKYISDIKSKRTRLIFEMHVFDNKKFWKIAMDLGGENTEESVKMIFYRYIKNNP